MNLVGTYNELLPYLPNTILYYFMIFSKKYSFLFFIVFVITMIIKPEVCFIEIGVFLICWGLFSLIIFIRIKKKGVQSMGKIVEFKPDSEGVRIPFVQFITESGINIKAQPFIFTSTNLNKSASHIKLRETDVLVKYDSENPELFLLISQKGFNTFFLWLMIIGGLLFILIGLASLLRYIKF